MPGRGSADVSSHRLCVKWLLVVRVFWRELAETGARRGEWQLLDGLRMGTRIVGSGPLSCALLIDVWARQCRRQQSQALSEVVHRILLEDMGAEGATFGPVIRVGGKGKKSLHFSPSSTSRTSHLRKYSSAAFPCHAHIRLTFRPALLPPPPPVHLSGHSPLRAFVPPFSGISWTVGI